MRSTEMGSLLFSKKTENIVGKVDDFVNGVLRGWACDLNNMKDQIVLNIFVENQYIGRTISGFYRSDLESVGYGDGRHEFRILLKSEEPIDLDKFSLRVSSSPDVVITSQGRQSRPKLSEQSLGPALTQLLRPLIASIDAHNNGAERRSTNPSLLKVTEVHGVPVSRFALHIAEKFGYCDVLSNDHEFLEFLRFYFETYSVAQLPYRIPLSDSERSYWKGPAQGYACRAHALFAPCSSRQSRPTKIYQWANYEAERLGLEDFCLDTSEVRSLATWSSVLGQRLLLPLNKFMVLFSRDHYALSVLDHRSSTHRAIIYLSLILFAVKSPHLRRFIPWKHFESSESRSAMKLALGRLVDIPDLDFPSFWRKVCLTFETAAPLPRKSGSMETSKRSIQMIAPFDRLLGLGESARRVGEAICGCDFDVELTNYDLRHPSPILKTKLKMSPLRNTEISLLHLNLEEIPEALAFSLKGIESSYIIAMPFLELDSLSMSHQLGLELVNEVWTASSFLTNLFKGGSKPVHTIGVPIRLCRYRDRSEARRKLLARFDLQLSHSVFLCTGDALSWERRKNVKGSIEAFLRAFEGRTDVFLIIKTHNIDKLTTFELQQEWNKIRQMCAKDTRVSLFVEPISEEDYCDLLSGVDCLISLHRAEGLGLDIMDAMAIGTAVIATGYSGNTDLCQADTCWIVEYDKISLRKGDYAFADNFHHWAEPRSSDAVEQLRRFMSEKEETIRKIERARARAAAVNGMDRVRQRIKDRLNALVLLRKSAGNPQ